MDDALKLQLNNLQLSKVTSTDKVIGRGAYGRAIEVYVHGTLCAAKEIHPALVENVSPQESETIRRSFCEECVKASRIHHPNIVQMLGIYYPTPQAKLPWLVMELMQTSLKGFLEKYEQGKVPLHFKLSMLVDVAQGLEFLHGQDIIHRDLSTNNVLLTKNLTAKIADLGVAKVIQENKMKTHTQTPGTPHFMPPEALKSKPHYGKAVDVFSLACVALQVMSHQWPEPKDLIPEGTMTALTEIQRRDEYITFCTQPALKELVELCLHNKPEQRPEISTVCEKLKELKVTIEKQIPFATDNNFELFDAIRLTKLQNQQLSAANTSLTEEKYLLLYEKDQQIQEKDRQIRERDRQIRERDKELQVKNQQLQEKNERIKELQMQNKSSSSENHKGIYTLPPVCYDDPASTSLDSVQHIDPSSVQDDVGTELIKGNIELGYHNPPLTKGSSTYGVSASRSRNAYAKQHSLPDSSVGDTTVYHLGKLDVSNLRKRLAKKQETTKHIDLRSSSNPADKRDLSSLKSNLEKKKEARAKVEGMNEGDHENFLPLHEAVVKYQVYISSQNPPKPTPRLKDTVPGESSVEFHKGHFAEPFSSERNFKTWLCVDCHCTNQVSSTKCSRCSKPQKSLVQGCIQHICDHCGLMFFCHEDGVDIVCPNCYTPLVIN